MYIQADAMFPLALTQKHFNFESILGLSRVKSGEICEEEKSMFHLPL